METIDLFFEAQDSNVSIIYLSIPETGSMCVQTDYQCYIGIDCDALEKEADQRVCLAHELGHCKTGAFYNRWAAHDIRQKHEHRADKWAIETLIPINDLYEAVAEGHTELWDLAEQFNVTETFMRKAVCWYNYGNLATELYF